MLILLRVSTVIFCALSIKVLISFNLRLGLFGFLIGSHILLVYIPYLKDILKGTKEKKYKKRLYKFGWY